MNWEVDIGEKGGEIIEIRKAQHPVYGQVIVFQTAPEKIPTMWSCWVPAKHVQHFMYAEDFTTACAAAEKRLAQ